MPVRPTKVLKAKAATVVSGDSGYVAVTHEDSFVIFLDCDAPVGDGTQVLTVSIYDSALADGSDGDHLLFAFGPITLEATHIEYRATRGTLPFGSGVKAAWTISGGGAGVSYNFGLKLVGWIEG